MDDQISAQLPEALQLDTHPVARNRTIAKVTIAAGTSILTVPAISAILIDSQKGSRCDACFRHSFEGSLKHCSGCGSYWYCGPECQTAHWHRAHKRICKRFNSFTATAAFQRLPNHEKLDTLLLTDLLSVMSHSNPPFSPDTPEVATFLDLMPFQRAGMTDLPPFPFQTTPPASLPSTLYSRFGNNNFAIHSHLNTIGHGIFPLASRLFNHSCLPNAAAKYQLSATRLPRMEIVALHDLMAGEEITIPYLDPAMLQSRHQILRLSYGFECECVSCIFLKRIGYLERKPEVVPKEDLPVLCTRLKEFAGSQSRTTDTPSSSQTFDSIPETLYLAFQETLVEQLSEAFSRNSHEGDHDAALAVGTPLLALYTLIYPLNYPQIGLHALEMAKTVWNGIIAGSQNPEESKRLKLDVALFLTLSRGVLEVYGPEGDDGGPLEEIATLERLLHEESA